jgi:P-type conjugative transfer protein TrbJ
MRTKLFVAVTLVFFLVSVKSAYCFKSVVDWKNLQQSIKILKENLQQTKQLKTQIQNEYQQIQHLVQQLDLMQRNVKRLELILEDPQFSNLQKMDAVLATSSNLSYSVDAVLDSFKEVYPIYKGPMDPKTLTEHNDQWGDQTRDSILKAMQSQGSVEFIPFDRLDLYYALEKSREAEGNLQAQQAGNEINASVAKQLMRLQYMISANARAASSQMAEGTSIERARTANHEYLMKDWNEKSRVKPFTDFP